MDYFGSGSESSDSPFVFRVAMHSFGIGTRVVAACLALVGALVASALAMNGEWLGFAAAMAPVALLAHAAGRGRDPVQRRFPAPPGSRVEPALRLAAGCLAPPALYVADTAMRDSIAGGGKA